MFSARFHWDFRPNRLTRALEARRIAGEPVVDLTESNPTHAGLDYPSEIAGAFADPRMLLYQPAPAGMMEAREAVASYYAARGRTVDPRNVLLTASTSEAYAYLFKLLCDPGDDVLVPRPSYPLFEFLAGMESVAVRHYPLVYHGGWAIDVDALAASISEPTGTGLPPRAFAKPLEFIRRKLLSKLLRQGVNMVIAAADAARDARVCGSCPRRTACSGDT